MKHLSEDELIELYYGEGGSQADAHMQTCRECWAQFAALRQGLEAIRPAMRLQRDAEYGERVWQNLEPLLVPYRKPAGRGRTWWQWRTAAVALSCALVLIAAFLGGRHWERIATHTTDLAKNPQATQRIVLVVLTDHLDRTERMLVSLEHADFSDSTENAALQAEARDLLVSNRLYRTTASSAGDPALAGALDRLEGVLAEIANDPNLTAADLRRVRKEMDADGILFEVRVLLARSPEQASGPKPAKGKSI